MNEDFEKAMDEAKDMTIPEGNFEGNVFWSTDGKMTVSVKADNAEGRKAALKWGDMVYERLKEKYGTKQALSKRVYSGDEDLGKCTKCGAANMRSFKGKVYCSAKCWLKEQML